MKTFKQIKQDIYAVRKCYDTVLYTMLDELKKKNLSDDERDQVIEMIKRTLNHKNGHEDNHQEIFELMGENKGIWIGAAAFASGMLIGKVITSILCRK